MHQSGCARSATRLAHTWSGIVPRFDDVEQRLDVVARRSSRSRAARLSLHMRSVRTQPGAKLGASFWKKLLALDAVGEAREHERAVLQVRQEPRRRSRGSTSMRSPLV